MSESFVGRSLGAFQMERRGGGKFDESEFPSSRIEKHQGLAIDSWGCS